MGHELHSPGDTNKRTGPSARRRFNPALGSGGIFGIQETLNFARVLLVTLRARTTLSAIPQPLLLANSWVTRARLHAHLPTLENCIRPRRPCSSSDFFLPESLKYHTRSSDISLPSRSDLFHLLLLVLSCWLSLHLHLPFLFPFSNPTYFRARTLCISNFRLFCQLYHSI